VADSSHRVLQGARFFADANIYQAEPDKQRGTEGGLTVSKANLSYFTLVKVNVSSLPKRKPVRDAVLLLYLVGEAFEAPLDMICCALQVDWDENTVTWNERRAETPWKTPSGEYDYNSPIADFRISRSYGRGWVAVRSPALTRLVNAWIGGSVSNHGLVLRPRPGNAPTTSKAFASKERQNPDQHPALIVSYDAPINPAAYGYISDHELARRPLRQKLDRLADSAKGIVPDWETIVRPLRRKLDKADVEQKAIKEATEVEIDQLRSELMASRWADEPVVVWPCGPWEPLAYDELPKPGAVALSARLLQNEYQELSVAVTNTTGRPLTVEVSLVSSHQLHRDAKAERRKPSGVNPSKTGRRAPPRFPKEKITLRGSYWITAKGQGYERGEGMPTLVDDALPRLASGNNLVLRAGRTRRLWLTVDTNGVDAGKYSLTLTLTHSAGNKEVARIPVDLHVLPIALEKDSQVAVHSYAYLNRPSTRDHLEQAVADLKAHYENTFIFESPPNPPTDEQGNVVGRANFDKLRSRIRLLKDARQLVFFWHECEAPHFQAKLHWMSAAHKKSLKIWLTDFVGVLREEGFDHDRFMMYPFDESYSNPVKGGRPELQALAEIADAIHEIDPRVRVFANPVTAHPKDDPLYEKLKGKIAAWSLHKLLLDPGDHTAGWPYNFTAADKHRVVESFFRNEQKAGRPLWAFQCEGRTKTKNVNGYYRRWSWQIWHVDFTGIGLWSYNDIRGGSSWSDSGDGAGGDFSMVYEMRDAPADIPREPFEPLIPSRRWQAWREGIQDYLLLQQVRKRHPAQDRQIKKLAASVLEDPENYAKYELARERLLDLLARR
jgi:hypothetical protein